MPSSHLTDRGVILVSGEDATGFLQGLVTGDVEKMKPGEGHLAALLSPQGKILFDFIVSDSPEGVPALPGLRGYFLDMPKAMVADLVKRLGFYKLRAKVQVAEAMVDGAPLAVVATWGEEDAVPWDALVARDARAEGLGRRLIVRQAYAASISSASEAEYHAYRVTLGVPEGGRDFAFGDAYPHDADMDQLGGVDFAKGCYVGQEIVSRMEHRGTARRRIVQARGAGLPASDAAITAGERPIGTLGSVAGGVGLALVRLDRAKEAIDAGTPLMAGGATLTLAIPGWAKFGWPATAAAE